MTRPTEHAPRIRRRSLLLAGVAASAGAAPWVSAQAQAYPSRPVTLIVPWPAGGSTDRHLRTLAELASKHLGQPITVENRPGAGGTLGPSTMAQTAKPDGYTIAQFPLGLLRMPHMQKTNWDPMNDFTYIIGLSGYTFGLTVRSDSPYKTYKYYIEAARQKSSARVDPCKAAASGASRMPTAHATSSIVVSLPSGEPARYSSSTSSAVTSPPRRPAVRSAMACMRGDSTGPGAIRCTVTPCRPQWSARERTRLPSAAFTIPANGAAAEGS